MNMNKYLDSKISTYLIESIYPDLMITNQVSVVDPYKFIRYLDFNRELHDNVFNNLFFSIVIGFSLIQNNTSNYATIDIRLTDIENNNL